MDIIKDALQMIKLDPHNPHNMAACRVGGNVLCNKWR